MNWKMPWGIILILSIYLVFSSGSRLTAATFTVNTTADTVDANPGDGVAADAGGNCSLRAAVMEANALVGPDIIDMPPGIYLLSISGADEDKGRSGDLDIFSNLTIRGTGRELTVIDGNQLDRVMHITGGWQVHLQDLTIRGGKTPDGGCTSYHYEDCRSGGIGGGILNRSGQLTILRCRIEENRTGGGSPGYGEYGGDGGYGGGIYSKNGSLTISDSLVRLNTCGRGGFGRSGGSGGGIVNNGGTLTLDNCEISRNRTGHDGGDDYLTSGASGSGGGIYNLNGDLILSRCTVKENETGSIGIEGYTGTGGGICNIGGRITIETSLIYRNKLGPGDFEGYGNSGGGIYNKAGNMSIVNSTICENRTGLTIGAGSIGGGGIYNSTGTMIMTNCTVTRNVSGLWGAGGGLYNDYEPGSIVLIRNTIIADNEVNNYWSGEDCAGTITSRGYNLVKDTDGCTITGDTTEDIYHTDPLLAPLADNGGPTWTYGLLPGSPAIDGADPDNFPGTDQRGVQRPKDGNGDGNSRADIGAFELFSPQIEITAPAPGARVRGTISIKAQANTRYVDFFVDGNPLGNAHEAPFACTWDTTLHANGSHQLRAVGYDTEEGFSAQDQIQVFIDNTVIQLAAARIQERAWIIQRLYSKISFTVTHAGSLAPSRYVIRRRDGDGADRIIKEVATSEVSNGAFTLHDPLPAKDLSYTYRVEALDSGGTVVGRSGEKSI